MKRSFCAFIIMISVFAFSACGKVETESRNEQTNTTNETIQAFEPVSNSQSGDFTSKESDNT